MCILLCLSACAGKHTGSLTPEYAEGSREAMLLDFQSTGSPCLDAIWVNLSNVGCNEVGVVDVEIGRMVGCLNPSPGATDIYSNSSFLVTIDPPEHEFIPWCGDQNGV